jgi:hypothetical protein
MAVTKKTERGKCPFILHDPCNPECAFYRKGIRYSEKPGSEPIPFEDCAFNIIADNLEAMHNRTYMMQKEVGDTKNMMALKTMVDLNIRSESNMNTLTRMLKKVINPQLKQDQVEDAEVLEIEDKDK